MTIFGHILSDDVVEDAVVATLRKWIGTTMSEVERQRGLTAGHYGRPRSFEVHSDFDSFPEDQLPRIVVVSMGWAEDPRMSGNKTFEVHQQIGIACIASSTDQTTSRRYAYRLGAAVLLAMTQHQSLDQAIGGRVTGVQPIERARNGELPFDADRTLWIHRQTFRVSVKDALTKWGGPVAPDAVPLDPETDPWPPNPVVEGGGNDIEIGDPNG